MPEQPSVLDKIEWKRKLEILTDKTIAFMIADISTHNFSHKITERDEQLEALLSEWNDRILVRETEDC